MKKILITCICLVLAGAFTFAISWGVINFNKVKEGMSGTGVYTEQDLNKAYEDGYGQGIKDKAEYLILIDEIYLFLHIYPLKKYYYLLLHY